MANAQMDSQPQEACGAPAAPGRLGHTVRLGPGAGPLEGEWPEAVRLAAHKVIREVLDRHAVADVDVH